MNFVEVFGTTASVVIAISLTMKNLKRLRVLNAVGALGFTVYGLLIGTRRRLRLNGFIVVIDIVFLWKMYASKDRFDVIESDPYASPFVALFLGHHKDDIKRYQPEFSLEPGKGWQTEFILRDLNPVSIVIYRRTDPATVEIGLDYAVPSYRDFQSAEYYFRKSAERIAAGKELTFIQRTRVPEHQRYLERIGFQRGADGPDGTAEFRKTVTGDVRG